jgi:hypothetical protein
MCPVGFAKGARDDLRGFFSPTGVTHRYQYWWMWNICPCEQGPLDPPSGAPAPWDPPPEPPDSWPQPVITPGAPAPVHEPRGGDPRSPDRQTPPHPDRPPPRSPPEPAAYSTPPAYLGPHGSLASAAATQMP